ncbi:hypothetical protein EASAB2608_06543 [Streptomyces sp. EAS-AB2608]|nr:hypothetical protein EASAB2608_06543 [Streptomyces sp. EAS-AB2608]
MRLAADWVQPSRPMGSQTFRVGAGRVPRPGLGDQPRRLTPEGTHLRTHRTPLSTARIRDAERVA